MFKRREFLGAIASLPLINLFVKKPTVEERIVERLTTHEMPHDLPDYPTIMDNTLIMQNYTGQAYGVRYNPETGECLPVVVTFKDGKIIEHTILGTPIVTKDCVPNLSQFSRFSDN